MKPYYQDKYCTIYHGDCLEIMPELKPVDLVFADPPFNVGKKYPKGDKRADYKQWSELWIRECWQLLKDTGSFYLMTISRYLDWKLPLMAKQGVFINLIKWRNVSASHGKRSFWGEYQPIALYGKTDDYVFNTYAETNKDGQRRWGGYSSEYKGQLKDYWDDIPFIYAGSIIHKEAVLEPSTNKKAHPCQMPVKLALRAINFSSGPRAIVLVPFMGSGTTLVAAKQLNRKAIGIEIEEKYCEIAVRRLAQEVMEL